MKPPKSTIDRVTPVKTHCPYCALQCGMLLSSAGEITPRTDVPANAGGALCQKGWTAAELLRPSRRLTTPSCTAKPPPGRKPWTTWRNGYAGSSPSTAPTPWPCSAAAA